MVEIKIKNLSNNPVPEYQTNSSSGMDIHCFCEDNIIIRPGERKLVPTGIFIEIPTGYEGQIRPRSGLALNHGVTVLNSPGTIDSDYRGELKVLLINLSETDFEIRNGDRIAQLIISKYEKVNFKLVGKLNVTKRNTGGYGHTG